MIGRWIAASALVLLALIAAAPAVASERILYFKSDVDIGADGVLRVTETIQVRAEGRQIKRGILRDFPTKYTAASGLTRNVGFQVISVGRNGRSENYRVENISNGKRIRIGNRDVSLEKGVHEYRIVYKTTRQLGFFDEYDELYWNATGNGWTFAIDRIDALITLPPGGKVVQLDAYTGAQGASGKDFSLQRLGDNQVLFSSTKSMPAGSGLSVAVAFPKGLVPEPTAADEVHQLLYDNRPEIYLYVGLLIVVGFYLTAWWMFGRDKRSDTTIPLFEPPEGFTPAAVRFIYRMGYDAKTLTAAIVNLAVKGAIEIDDDGGDYTLRSGNGEANGLHRRERKLLTGLLGYRDSIELKQSNHVPLGKARKQLRDDLDAEFDEVVFIKNRWLFIFGAAFSVLVLAASLIFGGSDEGVMFILVWLSVWVTGTCAMAYRLLRHWRLALTSVTNAIGMIFGAVFLFPFIVAPFGLFFGTTDMDLLPLLVGVAAMGFSNILFFHLLKAPTAAGRVLLTEIEGFRMYLMAAEKERLDFLHPPKKTPELFERFLPYALALDVENEWGDQFDDVLAAAATGDGGSYSPRWYHGSSYGRFNAGGFSSSLASGFTSATAAAATAPGSSSGSGGGGSSGGGGGGGGGSGW